MTTEEQERAAYCAGNTAVSELLARIVDLEQECDELEEKVETLTKGSVEKWNNENGRADEYREFFFDCFSRLDRKGCYPVPEISSNCDKMHIFDAIRRGVA